MMDCCHEPTQSFTSQSSPSTSSPPNLPSVLGREVSFPHDAEKSIVPLRVIKAVSLPLSQHPTIWPLRRCARDLLEQMFVLLAAAPRLMCPRQAVKDTRIRRKSFYRSLFFHGCILLISLVLLPLTDGQLLNNTAVPTASGETLQSLNSTEEVVGVANVTGSNVTDFVPSLSPSTNPGLIGIETAAPTQQHRFVNTTNATEEPSLDPTMAPSSSFSPTLVPTVSPQPSLTPSISPSLSPSISLAPSNVPTFRPTFRPSTTPSEMPSMLPTMNNSILVDANYVQKFTLEGIKFFNESEVALIGSLMENYTSEFAEDSIGQVNTTFSFLDQKSSIPPLTVAPQNRQLRHLREGLQRNNSTPLWQRMLQTNFVNTLTYRMSYESDTMNVTSYPEDFELFINQDLVRLTADLKALGIDVVESEEASRFFTQTPQPTISSQPSFTPTARPTFSAPPSAYPSVAPSLFPSNARTISPMPTESPSESPTGMPSSAPTFTSTSDDSTLIIVIAVVVVALLIAIGLFIFYRKRKRLQEQQFHASQSMNNVKRGEPTNIHHNHPGGMDGSWNAAVGKSGPPKALLALDSKSHYSPDGRGPSGGEGLISPSESLVSNQSLLSAGNSMGGDSGDEADTTQNLQDEFDQYKDQNLEKMRAEVEGNLTGFDGMMSQALTKALMDDDELHVEPSELLWGGVGQQSGAEVEASALCEVTDWLKRNDNAPIDGKRNFMQEMLNKMVSSVRHGVLGPDDASRAIHECAALLNLQLASDLPVTTVIITGMRKMATAADVIEAFREFGEIDDAAVASNQRGFGLVRFKTPKSVDRAMRKFLIEEIVVQDVAVQVKVLTPTKGGDAAFRSGTGSHVSKAPNQ